MAAENNKRLNDEVRKKIHEALDDYYDRCDDRMEAIDDNFLDGIVGGEWDGNLDNHIKSWRNTKGYTIIKYKQADTCSYCNTSKRGVFYDVFYPHIGTNVYCEDCAKVLGFDK